MNEKRHTNRGKWSQQGVPHRGWICVGTEDLEEPSQLCEMCESADIRYVHYMEHPDYPETLGVGCICAEHMESNYVQPRLREKELRTKSRRQKSWEKRKWKVSVKGNSYLNTEGFNLTVFALRDAKGAFWGLRVMHRASGAAQRGRNRYSSEQEARKAALKALMWAKENLAG